LIFLHVVLCGPAYRFFGFRSVFHPWLKDLLFYCFKEREFDRWQRNQTGRVFRVLDSLGPASQQIGVSAGAAALLTARASRGCPWPEGPRRNRAANSSASSSNFP
jgi:hypothetical protein